MKSSQSRSTDFGNHRRFNHWNLRFGLPETSLDFQEGQSFQRNHVARSIAERRWPSAGE